MDQLLEALAPGRPATVHLIGGATLSGAVVAADADWVKLMTAQGEALIATRAIAAAVFSVGPPAAEDAPDAPLPRPQSKDAPIRSSPKAPGRPWGDDDLRMIAHAFLDGVKDADLAVRYSRTRHQITILRQAHEVLRGNLREDQIGDVAAAWIPRLRRILGGAR